jgi:hypothetical protein
MSDHLVTFEIKMLVRNIEEKFENSPIEMTPNATAITVGNLLNEILNDSPLDEIADGMITVMAAEEIE